jgi:hypothetical protein
MDQAFDAYIELSVSIKPVLNQVQNLDVEEMSESALSLLNYIDKYIDHWIEFFTTNLDDIVTKEDFKKLQMNLEVKDSGLKDDERFVKLSKFTPLASLKLPIVKVGDEKVTNQTKKSK